MKIGKIQVRFNVIFILDLCVYASIYFFAERDELKRSFVIAARGRIFEKIYNTQYVLYWMCASAASGFSNIVSCVFPQLFFQSRD